ncbi:unnamed protein product [Adineta steineri]|uniref:Phospholipase n=1 Tax=Adineta steineri TaxID=433720 RepID=A0A819PCG6_9BILA|nr:unnamed protein product [Adineta steineri]
MTENDQFEGIDDLVQSTEDAVEFNLIKDNMEQTDTEYLPDSDWNYEAKFEELVQAISINNNDEQNDNTSIFDLPVQVTKIEAEKIHNPITDFRHPYLYTISIRSGSAYEWTIKKRYKHFIELHKDLLDYAQFHIDKIQYNLNTARLSTNDIDDMSDYSIIDEEQSGFPINNDHISFISKSSNDEQCKILQEYLNKILKHPKLREHRAVTNFLEVSHLSFALGLGKSLQEGDLLKRSKNIHHEHSIFLRTPFLLDKYKSHHGRKWFVIKDSYFVNMKFDSIVDDIPMLVDPAFSIEQGFWKTKTKNGIRIENLQHLMIIKCQSEDERDVWFNSLLELKTTSIFTQQHRFFSFSPIRRQQYAQWFVKYFRIVFSKSILFSIAKNKRFINGQSYTEALVKAILAAREEIFITDWWLSPEIMLIRPFQDDSMRLDNLLGRRAEEGIRIYVLIYNDIESTMGLNSRHSKRKLISKSPIKKNIKVIQHPHRRLSSGLKTSFLFSPHEKLVIIDQRLAFIGGMDLCFGRWDNHNYRLIDLGDENITELKLPEQLIIESITNKHTKTRNFEKNVHDPSYRDTQANVTKKVTKKESSNEDNELQKQADGHEKKWRRILKVINRKSDSDDSSDPEQDVIVNKQPRTNVDVTSVTNDKCYLFPGKDYANYYEKDFEALEKYDEGDYIDRKSAPRLPWHDEMLVVAGEAARDCARHFIQRWNIHKRDNYSRNESYPYLLPKTYDDAELVDTSLLRSILPDNRPPICIDAQCIRSSSYWSSGIRTVEHSSENAYVDMINNAQHFIYIENQFFITIADDTIVKNKIADALYRRIIRACVEKEKFRIYVILPLLAAFSDTNSVRAVFYFIMRSINKGEMSLYQRLKQNGVPSPEEYITFYGMRNWDILMGNLVTEIIYVHAKLMIVDDQMCICGSANINDRSLLGTRDSEVCLVVNDLEMIDSHLNDQMTKVGRFCSTWRKTLFRHILGIENEEEINVDDPCTDEFYEYFRRIAKNNTQIYEEVFNTIPTNQVRQYDDIEAYSQRPSLKDTDPQTAYNKCKQIQGFIVEFPIEFLTDDSIMPKLITSQGVAPSSLWT